jgi:hypothetical protein
VGEVNGGFGRLTTVPGAVTSLEELAKQARLAGRVAVREG